MGTALEIVSVDVPVFEVIPYNDTKCTAEQKSEQSEKCLWISAKQVLDKDGRRVNFGSADAAGQDIIWRNIGYG